MVEQTFIPSWVCGKFPVTWSWVVVIAGYSNYLHYLHMASIALATLWHKCDEKQNSKVPNFYKVVKHGLEFGH